MEQSFSRLDTKRVSIENRRGRRGKVCIIAAIPAYNEEYTIGKIVLLSQRYVDKVLVCDDGSQDLTGEIAERLGAIVIRHEKNMGKGAALRSLFKKALELGADIVVTLDADNQHDPNDIPKLVEPILKGEVDIVNGSRFLGDFNDEIPLHRKIGNKVLSRLTNTAGSINITDTQSGFRAYSRKALERIEISTNGIGVDTEIILKAKGLRTKEVPITCRYRGIRVKRNPFKHGFEVLATIINYVAEKRPLLIVGVPGFIVFTGGLFMLVYVIYKYFQVRHLGLGTMLLAITSIITGMFAMFTALILYTITKRRRDKNTMLRIIRFG